MSFKIRMSGFNGEVRLEQHGREVRVIFLIDTEANAELLVDLLLPRMKAGEFFRNPKEQD